MSKIYVGNLPASIDEPSLEAAFSLCGAITKTEVIHYDDSSVSRAYGFVTFEDPDSINKARKFIQFPFVDTHEGLGYPLSIFAASEHKYGARVEMQEPITKQNIMADLRVRHEDKFYEDIIYEPNNKKNNVTVYVDFKTEEAREEFLRYGFRFSSKRPTIIDLPKTTVAIPRQQGSYMLYIGNIPPGTTEQELRAIFKLCGDIGTVTIEPVENYLKKGSIAFTTREASEMAASFQGTFINKWPAPVILSYTPFSPRYNDAADYPENVYVRHFGSGVTLGDIEIKLCPDQIGSVKGVRPRDWERKGFVYMYFESHELALRALGVSGKLYLGGDRPATIELNKKRVNHEANHRIPPSASMENLSVRRVEHPGRALSPSQLNVVHKARHVAFMENLDKKPRCEPVAVAPSAPPLLTPSVAGPSRDPEPSYALPAFMSPVSPPLDPAIPAPLLTSPPSPVQGTSQAKTPTKGPYQLIVQHIPNWMGEDDIVEHFRSLNVRDCEFEFGDDDDDVKLYFVRKMGRDKALRGPHPDGMTCRRGSDVGKCSDY